MEYTDLSITLNNTLIGLITVYRPPPSKKHKLTKSIFFHEFSTILEKFALVSGNLLFCGDFNFHMDDITNNDTKRFIDLLDSAGLKQRITDSTHSCGHMLDLFIDRQDKTLLCGGTEVVSDVPSDHSAIICTLDLPKPRSGKKEIRHRNLRRMDMQAWQDDKILGKILESPLHMSTFDTNARDINTLTNQFNSVLQQLINKLRQNEHDPSPFIQMHCGMMTL